MDVDELLDDLSVYYEEDPSWRDDALCSQIDPDLWFPGRGGASKEAKAICAMCPVRQECADYAIKAKVTYGIWGGLGRKGREQAVETAA